MANDLDEYTDEVELILRDSANTIWSTDQLKQPLRDALARYSQVSPQLLTAEETIAADKRLHTLTTTDRMQIVDLWYPYTAATPEDPPERPSWHLLSDTVLYISGGGVPVTGLKLYLTYTKAHTLKDLDSATATTPSTAGKSLICQLAAALAVLSYGQHLANAVTASGSTPVQYMRWAEMTLARVTQDIQEAQRRQSLTIDARIHWDAEI